MIAIPNKIKQHQDKTVRKHSGIPTYEKTWIHVQVIKKIINKLLKENVNSPLE